MKYTALYAEAIKRIARALGELNARAVYVGGAVVGLYSNDSAAGDVRPTKDVDISLEILTEVELEKLRQDLISRGFRQTAEDNVMCRFRYGEIKVDVMSTKGIGWAPANVWFQPGFKYLEIRYIDGKAIRILPPTYFLATKFSAFHDRGGDDPRTSHDFEDISYILDNRTDLVELIPNAPQDVREYLTAEFNCILRSESLQEAIIGNLPVETQEERFQLIMEKLQQTVDLPP